MPSVICIGDSITAGSDYLSDGYRTYRGTLKTLLTAGGVTALDFVGPNQMTPASGGQDPDHAAWGGAVINGAAGLPYSSNNISDRLASLKTGYPAVDLIVLYIGWNDIYSFGIGIATRYETLLNAVQSGAWASKKVVCCTIHPEPGKTEAQTGASYAEYAAINTKIRALCAASPTTRIVADLATISTFVTTDYWVNTTSSLVRDIHMLQPGADKLAARISAAILASGALGVGGSMWAGPRLPTDVLIGAVSAAASASTGTKNAAYLGHIQGQIGTGYLRQLYRDNVLVWQATMAGALPIVSSSFVLPQVAAQTAISAADIATGEWVHYVRNAANPAKYIATRVTALSGAGPAKLSGNLVGGGTVALDSFVLNSPTLDSVSAAPGVDQMVAMMGAKTFTLPGAPVPDRTWGSGGYVVRGADLRSEAVPAWWGGNPRADISPYWAWAFPWYLIWDMPGHEAGLNTWCAVDKHQLWALNDSGVWSLVIDAGADWVETYNRSQNGPGFATPIRQTGVTGGTINPALDGMLHGGGGTGQIGSPATVRALQVRVRARKRLINAAGADDRALARYAVQAGLDVYPESSANMSLFGGVGYNPGVGASRFVEIGTTDTWVYMTTLAAPPSVSVDAGISSYPPNFRQTLSESSFRANPPPAP